MGYVHSICFPKNNETHTAHLLAATETGFVYLWDLQVKSNAYCDCVLFNNNNNGLQTNRVRHKQEMGKSIQALHARNDNLITQEKDGAIKLWQMRNETYELIRNYNYHGGYCKSLLLDDESLVVPQENGQLDIVDYKTMECVRKFTTTKTRLGNVMCLQKVIINGSVYVLAGFEAGDIILWDFLSGAECSHIKLRECITSLTFDAATGRGICGNASNILQIFTVDKNFTITLKCEISIKNDGCNIVKLRPDRKIFVSGGWDGRLRLFSWKSLRLLVVLAEHRNSITDVQFTEKFVELWNSNIMAASGADGMISLWNLYN